MNFLTNIYVFDGGLLAQIILPVKQGGTLSPVFFNVYMDNLSLQLNAQLIGCSDM